jgi:hypothetical protein
MAIKRRSLLAIVTLLTAGLSSACTANADRAKDTGGKEPNRASGGLEMKEEVWYPWRFESLVWEDDAWMHFRQHEEKAAADELRKSESWLKFAASHALPQSREALEAAASDLDALATDLEQGNVVKASRLRYAVARADDALADWHYFKARDGAGRSEDGTAAEEEADAALHLRTAARYLEHAAASARIEYGPQTTSFSEDIDEFGRVVDEGATIEPAHMARHLDDLEHELKTMAKTLEATADKHTVG